MRRPVFGGGALQLAVCGALLAAGLAAAGLGWVAALVAGLALALSSTAIAVQTMAERNLLAAPIGRAAFAVLLFQDIAAIPLIALVPLLAAEHADAGNPWLGARQGARRDRRGDRHRPLPHAPGAAPRRARRAARGVHRVRAAARGRHRRPDVARRPVDGARRVPRRRAARELRVPARARDRHRAVQGPPARPLLHRGRHVDRLRPARRAPAASSRASRSA